MSDSVVVVPLGSLDTTHFVLMQGERVANISNLFRRLTSWLL